MRRTILTVTLCLAVRSATRADTASPFKPTDVDRNWVQGRIDFITKMYGLNEAQVVSLRDTATKLMNEEAAYENDPKVKLSVRSLQVALENAISDNKIEDIRSTIMDRLRSQLYGIYGRAPLSYAHLLGLLEPTLPRDQVDKGHERLKARLADSLRNSKLDLTVANIDILAGEAVELPSLAPPKLNLNIPPAPPVNVAVAPTPPPKSQMPMVANAKNPAPPVVAPPPVAMPPPPPSTPREYPPAPPAETWASNIDGLTSKYGFTPEQLAKAKAVLDQANKLGSSGDKAAVNEAYGVLTERITALASMEQRIKADGEKAVQSASPTVIAPTPIVPSSTPPTILTPQKSVETMKGAAPAAPPTPGGASKTPAPPGPAAPADGPKPAPAKPAEPPKQ